MAEATDEQMQAYANDRIRVRAEQTRALIASLRDDKVAITDVYDRADGGAAWDDDRTDGPPKLLASSDVLAFNAFADLLLKAVDGTATEGDIGQLASNWITVQTMCVRPIGA